MPGVGSEADPPRLTKANIRALANAAKRDAAHRRGEQTPSAELLHLCDSFDTVNRRLNDNPLLEVNRNPWKKLEDDKTIRTINFENYVLLIAQIESSKMI